MFDHSPIAYANRGKLLHQMLMAPVGGIWDVICFLNCLHNIDPGFDNSIKYNSLDRRPEGVCWIFLSMKLDLL